MPMIVTIWDDVIEQGATFYRELALTQPADITLPYHPVNNSVVVDLTNKTPRATLMDADGAHVADFACAKISAAGGTMAWTLSRTLTGDLIPGKSYTYNIDLDDNIDTTLTDRAQKGSLSVNRGQKHQ